MSICQCIDAVDREKADCMIFHRLGAMSDADELRITASLISRDAAFSHDGQLENPCSVAACAACHGVGRSERPAASGLSAEDRA